MNLNLIRSLVPHRGKVYGFTLFLLVVFALIYYFSLPEPLFNTPYTTVLESDEGHLLGAGIADDGQWRFPMNTHVPDKFKQAIILFEDKNFERHLGIDPLAIGRALIQNIKAGKIVSGASTLSMQVIRLSRRESRTLAEKIAESLLAFRLELRYTKDEILAHYAAHAPFGGNVVGLEAAAWRYFGRNADQLSWAESTALAILPNSPSIIYPGKNEARFLEKRNRLLKKLFERGHIDSLSYHLACLEPLPSKAFHLPRLAPHLLDRLSKDGFRGQRIRSTVQHDLQVKVQVLVNTHHVYLKSNEIHNAAAIVLDTQSGAVLAYIGNVSDQKGFVGQEVDVIMAPRSTGSILKPFLYAASLDDGLLLPGSLLSDVPTFMKGFVPQNFHKTFDGMVPANQALIRSLNVPFVLLLQEFGIEKFHHLLKQLGMQTLTQEPNHYGLSLILGGAEGRLWDISGMYAAMGRSMNRYFSLPEPHRYNRNEFVEPHYIANEVPVQSQKHGILSAGAIYQTLTTLTELNRPNEDQEWQQFTSKSPIAWKTGTSFGFRDAWAVGVTPQYTVGVWVGNASGEGRPGLTGIQMAAPLLLELFAALPSNQRWFSKPNSDLQRQEICTKSGFKKGLYCETFVEQTVPMGAEVAPTCPYHQRIHLDKNEQYRVHSGCYPITQLINKPWFVLPPVEEWYYATQHPSYKKLPTMMDQCESPPSVRQMEIIYPKNLSKVYIPIELDEQEGELIFEAVHREDLLIYWHLNEKYIGFTEKVHQMAIKAPKGNHTLILVDSKGKSIKQHFQVLSK